MQAAIPPSFGVAIAPAHALQTGAVGNIPAHALWTHCCDNAFITATNTTAFSGGQDARDYHFVQSSDVQNTTTALLAHITPQATTALTNEAHTGEQLVTPLCTPHTTSSADVGAATASVTVAVTQTCQSVAYQMDSLTQVATQTLVQSANLSQYEQVGTTQVTVTGSTYEQQSARLHVSIAGVWVYHLTQAELQQLVQQVAGQSQEKATATLERVAGIAQVSIHLHRLDFKDALPTDPQHITVQLFYMVS